MRRLAAALAGLGAALAAPDAHAQAFVDVTKASGLQALRDMKPADIWLSGTHLLDLDGDGDLDFFFGSHGGFHGIAGVNDGHGKFTPASLPMPSSSEMHLIYDLDENGLPDVSFTEGDGVTRWFLSTATPGVPAFKSTSWVQAYSRNGAMADLDGDGNVDWICGGGQGGTGNPEAVWIYFGDGKGAFRKDPQAIVIPSVDRDTARPIAVDLDQDGDLDLVVEWQGLGTDPANRPRIYRNDGATGGKVTLTIAGPELGIPETSGVAILGFGDLDQDGDTDLIGRDKALFTYVNDGHGHFTIKAGLVTGEQPKNGDLVVATTTDLDNDGVADVIVGGFSTMYLLRGTGGGAFTLMNGAWGVTGTDPNGSRVCFAFGDVDGDGDLDLVGPRAAPPKMQYNVYRNDLPAKSWLNVRPVGHAGNRGAMGALISITDPTTNKLVWFEEVGHHGPQIMQNTYGYAETERHFGLGARATVDVSVLFRPSNKLVIEKGVAANATVKIGEDGTGTIVPPAMPPSIPPEPAVDAAAPPVPDAGDPTPDATPGTGAAGTGAPPLTSAAGTPGAAGTGGVAGAPAGPAGAPGQTGGGLPGDGGCACGVGHGETVPWAMIGLFVLVSSRPRRKRPGPISRRHDGAGARSSPLPAKAGRGAGFLSRCGDPVDVKTV